MTRKVGLAVAGAGLLALGVALLAGASVLFRDWMLVYRLKAMGPMDAAAVPDVMVLLGDRRPKVRHAAAEALGKIGPWARAATPALVRTLKDPDPRERSGAAWALGWIGPAEEVVPPLIEALDDDDPEVRRYAAHGLSVIGPPAESAIPKLIERLDDPWMRYMAARALGAIGPAARRSIPRLVTALRAEHSLARSEMAVALGLFGAEAAPAVPDLLALSNDPDATVQRSAVGALMNIDPDVLFPTGER
jgi:HEAT repeat protein